MIGRAIPDLKERLIAEEGVRENIYPDHLGLDTIGVGHCLDPVKGTPLPEGWEPPLSHTQIMALLDYDLEQKGKELAHELQKRGLLDAYASLDPVRKGLVQDACYQLGAVGFCGWNGFWSAVRQGDTNRAADELLDSLCAEQTTARMFRRAALWRNTLNPQPDLEKLPPNRTSHTPELADRKRQPGDPPLRLPSETEQQTRLKPASERDQPKEAEELRRLAAEAAAEEQPVPVEGSDDPRAQVDLAERVVRARQEKSLAEDAAAGETYAVSFLDRARLLYESALADGVTKTGKPWNSLTEESRARWVSTERTYAKRLSTGS